VGEGPALKDSRYTGAKHEPDVHVPKPRGRVDVHFVVRVVVWG